MTMPYRFTDEEAGLMADQHFFRAKAQIMAKVRDMLDATHAALKEEVGVASLVTPPDFDPTSCQFVKGEHLELFHDIFGPAKTLVHMRKHLCWYTHGLANAAAFRQHVNQSRSVAELRNLLSGFAAAAA